MEKDLRSVVCELSTADCRQVTGELGAHRALRNLRHTGGRRDAPTVHEANGYGMHMGAEPGGGHGGSGPRSVAGGNPAKSGNPDMSLTYPSRCGGGTTAGLPRRLHLQRTRL